MSLKSGKGRKGGNGGFTLVEVLVSLLLFTVGVLAIAQLLWFSMGSSTTAYQRTLAHLQAQDLAERMWLRLDDPTAVLDEWRNAHGSSLPGWGGDLSQPQPAEPDLYEIQVVWDDPASASAREHRYLVRLPVVAP